MIEPTCGRIVLFHPKAGVVQPAIIVEPHSAEGRDRIDIMAFGRTGSSFYPLVPLEQDDPIETYPKCCWMDYQKGQAAKTDRAEFERDRALDANREAKVERSEDEEEFDNAEDTQVLPAEPTEENTRPDVGGESGR